MSDIASSDDTGAPPTYARKDILPAVLRPGMYTGEQGDRSLAEWTADAVAEYLNLKPGIVVVMDD